MNVKQLSKQVGFNYRLRPLPVRLALDGTSLPEADDYWRFDALLDNPVRLKLVNIHTHHFIDLGADNVREFRSPDFLLLRCQLTISGHTVSVEPIVPQPRGVAMVSAGTATVQVAGDALRLLEYVATREQARLFDYAEADESIGALQLAPDAYRDAAEELGELGLVTVHGNANHPTGIARLVLRPEVFLAVCQQFFPDYHCDNELKELFAALKQVPRDHRLRIPDLLKTISIPLPRLDLMLRGLEEMGYIVGYGPGHDEWGSNLDVEITTKGRRMLRGDEAFPYLDGAV